MAKYYGAIGFAVTQPRADFPSVYEEVITEKSYSGDLTRNTRRLQTANNSTNNDFSLSNEISIICDDYIMNNFSKIIYATIYGAKWSVTNVEIQRPRLILTIGGPYHENH